VLKCENMDQNYTCLARKQKDSIIIFAVLQGLHIKIEEFPPWYVRPIRSPIYISPLFFPCSSLNPRKCMNISTHCRLLEDGKLPCPVSVYVLGLVFSTMLFSHGKSRVMGITHAYLVLVDICLTLSLHVIVGRQTH
jgi:hypothetical protein